MNSYMLNRKFKHLASTFLRIQAITYKRMHINSCNSDIKLSNIFEEKWLCFSKTTVTNTEQY